MTRSCQTRRNFLLRALSTMGGVIGVSACQQTINHVQMAQPNASITPSPQSASTASTETSTKATPATTEQPPAPTSMPERLLGKTGQMLPVLGLGGSASPLSQPSQEATALAIIQRAVELGIRYFDTAANYGPSEDFLGKVLPAHRENVVIATKTSKRDYDGAWRELERSLQRLKTDSIDLWQFHALTYDWDVDTLLQPQTGAIKAAQEAQEQGLIRYVGVSGHHDANIIATALRRYPFDTALVPINAADKHTDQPFITTLLPVAQEQNVAVIAMKVPAYGKLFKPGVLSGMPEALGYTLSQPGVQLCIIAADTVAQLEENVAAAQDFQPLDAATMADIEQRTASVWQENSFFRRWT
ncbi:MAG: aldo/keto reductase [Thainema sp.]